MNTPDDLNSPYQPPAAELSDRHEQLPRLAPHERSAAPKVFGVLSIIFASIVLLFSTLGLLAGAATGAAGGAAGLSSTDADKIAAQAGVKVLEGFAVQSLILFVMSALLLAIGIGQLRYRVWARRWSVYWAGAALVCVGLLVAISMLIISPAYAELFDSASSQLKPGAEGLGSMGNLSMVLGGTFAVMCVIFYTPYPAMMLLFFTREHVRASMTE
ncbi:MAG TPA: hypothetical protein VKQ32_23940 [Polyangia bacterium]|nr:hypothetical protein [Polyangia bacterium]